MRSAIARRDEDRIPCKWCGEPTRMLGTKECDRCWEVRTRVLGMPLEALDRILANRPLPK